MTVEKILARLAARLARAKDEKSAFLARAWAKTELKAGHGYSHEAARDLVNAAGRERPRLLPHTERLLQAGTDAAAFDAVFKALKADRSIRKADWCAIANEYRNAPTGGTYIHKFRTVSEAQRAIRGVFVERLEAESKSKIIDRLFA